MSKNVATFDVDMAMKELSKNRAKSFGELSRKKNRDKFSLFLVEGAKSVVDSLPSFELENLIVYKDWISKHPEIKKKYGDKILVANDKSLLHQVSSLSSVPEVIAVFKIPDNELEVENLEPEKFYVMLDGVQDPGNLGTIIRTCDWFGITRIFASQETVDVYNQKVVQSAMGSLSRVKVWYGDLSKVIDANPSIPVYGAMLKGKPINEVIFSSGGFILMGNEGNGVSEVLQRKITVPITIPPANPSSHPDSLNVAIATAIILYKCQVPGAKCQET